MNHTAKHMFTRFLRLSRPRFWLYTLGPFALPMFAQFRGVALEWPVFLIGLLYFSFPANLFIYGINDIFDQETDARNAKKEGYELRLLAHDVKPLLWTILLVNIPFLFALSLLAPTTLPALIGFVFFGLFYSAPPIRAKTKPVLDGVFNVLYVFPALVAVSMFPHTHIHWMFVVAGICWCMAMHAFSAIPDREADASAHIHTVAIFLGSFGTTVYCGILWVLSALLATFAPNGLPGTLALFLLAPYIYLLGKTSRTSSVLNVYRVFPYVNAFVGTCIALYLLSSTL